MAVDYLDIAYIAIGAKQALAACPPSQGVGPFEGELAYVQACIDYAGLLDREWEASGKSFPGVWCYEVVEPFGYEMGRHLLGGGGPGEVEIILEKIVSATGNTPPR